MKALNASISGDAAVEAILRQEKEFWRYVPVKLVIPRKSCLKGRGAIHKKPSA